MNEPENVIKNILQTAIQREIDAFNLYSSVAEKVETRQARGMLTELAAQEKGHRSRLESLLAGQVLGAISRAQQRKVADLKITDYLIEVPLAPDSGLQDILIVAGKREKASHDLYASLAQVTEDADTVHLFEFLASEELAHKERVESLYEELFYQDN